jgi:hypothetical protein
MDEKACPFVKKEKDTTWAQAVCGYPTCLLGDGSIDGCGAIQNGRALPPSALLPRMTRDAPREVDARSRDGSTKGKIHDSVSRWCLGCLMGIDCGQPGAKQRTVGDQHEMEVAMPNLETCSILDQVEATTQLNCAPRHHRLTQPKMA